MLQQASDVTCVHRRDSVLRNTRRVTVDFIMPPYITGLFFKQFDETHPESKEPLSTFHTMIAPMLAQLEGQEMQ